MEYCIEYENGKCHNSANGRADLLDWLKILKDETITDIVKVFKSGATDSVIDKYRKYINEGGQKQSESSGLLHKRNHKPNKSNERW